MKTYQTHIRKIILALQVEGLCPRFVTSDDPEQTDDEIEVTRMVSIQMAPGYAVVSAWTGPAFDEMQHWGERDPAATAKIVADVLAAVRTYPAK